MWLCPQMVGPPGAGGRPHSPIPGSNSSRSHSRCTADRPILSMTDFSAGSILRAAVAAPGSSGLDTCSSATRDSWLSRPAFSAAGMTTPARRGWPTGMLLHDPPACWRFETNWSNSVVNDTASIGNDQIGCDLTFFGVLPRIAMFAQRDKTSSAVWTVLSSDGGVNWLRPSMSLRMGGRLMANYISIASGSMGQGALVSELISNNVGAQCGLPKLSVSPDFVNWTTCSPAGNQAPQTTPSFACSIWGQRPAFTSLADELITTVCEMGL